MRNSKNKKIVYITSKNKKSKIHRINLNKIKKRIIFIGLIIILIVFGYTEYNLYTKLKINNKKIENVQKKYDEEVKRSEELDYYEEYIETREFKENIAREKLGLAYEDEIIFKMEK